MDLHTDGWTRLIDDPEHKSLLEPLGMLWQIDDDPARRDWLANDELRADIGFSIGVMTVRIWEYFRDETERPIGDSRPVPIRRAPKTSRNAPCACGSGKKFKRCCGA